MEYKIKQLMAMLEAEQNSDDKYGAHLTHWAGTAKPINIDERARQEVNGNRRAVHNKNT